MNDLPPPRKSRSAVAVEAEYQPTLKDVSEQVSAVSFQLSSMHGELATIRSDLSSLTRHVLGDHGPRLAVVEKKASRRVVTAGKYAGAAALIPLLEWLIPVVQGLLEKK